MDAVNIIKYEEGLERIVELTTKRSIIPFFGAGFTAGNATCAGDVPNSNTAKDHMIRFIIKYAQDEFPERKLAELAFYDLAGIFFEKVPYEIRSEYFEYYYTGVVLFQHQIDFLKNVNWPYAYTINVDDGIENNSDFTKILPYHKIRRPHTSKKLLYKLHGDAAYESTYSDENQENIVFSQEQYMQAITADNNSDIYKALLSDYSQNNLLFVGCSLENEQDIQFVYNKCKPFLHETYRIVLRRKTPDAIELQNLKKHGINEVVLVHEYEDFYKDFLEKYSEKQREVRENIYKFLNPTITNLSTKESSLKLLSGSNIFDESTNVFSKGALHVLRNAVAEVVGDLKTNSCVLLKGRRFGGKTYVLCSLVERYRTKDIYYFPSSSFADEDIVERLFVESKNSLYLFDSNSISPDVYGLILKYVPTFEDQNSKIVIAVNSSDNFLPSKLGCNIIELNNSFIGDELLINNKAADAFGLSRRKFGQTNIDYLYVLKKEQNIIIPFTASDKLMFTPNERCVLIALCALDKLYYSDLIALNFAQSEINILCRKLSPFIELVPVAKDEMTRHSTKKLVHNSKIAVVEL